MLADELKSSLQLKIKEIIDKAQNQELLSEEELKVCILKQFFCQYKLSDQQEARLLPILRVPENFRMGRINFTALPKENISKILILDFHLIGDTTYLVAFINVLQKHYPEAVISCLSWDNHLEVIHNHPGLKTTYHFKAREFINSYLESEQDSSILSAFYDHIVELMGYIENEKYDLVINLQPSRLSCLVNYLTKAKFQQGWSLDQENRMCFNGNLWSYLSIYADVLHRAEQLIRIVDGYPDVFDPFVENTRIFENNLVKEILPSGQSFFGIIPAARFLVRCWDFFRFAQLADRISIKFDLKSVIFCKKEEGQIAGFIESKMSNKPVNLCGKTSLFNIRDFIQRCEFLVTNDTGPKHIAVTLGVPVVEIRGPGENIRNCGPFGPNNIILEANIDCVGCNSSICETKKCLDLITVDAVYQAVVLLKKIKQEPNLDCQKINRLVLENIDKDVFKNINLFYSGWELPEKDYCFYQLYGEFNAVKELRKIIDYCKIKVWESKNDYFISGKLRLVNISEKRLLRPLYAGPADIVVLTEHLAVFLSHCEEFKKYLKGVYEDKEIVKNKDLFDGILGKAPAEILNLLSLNFGLYDLMSKEPADKFVYYALLDVDLFCIYLRKCLKIIKEKHEIQDV